MTSRNEAFLKHGLAVFVSCLVCDGHETIATGSPLSPTLARVDAALLVRNVARLDQESPGASEAVLWSDRDRRASAPLLADGDLIHMAAVLQPKHAAGIIWPVEHSIDGVRIFHTDAPFNPHDYRVETFDGETWRAIPFRIETEADSQHCLVKWGFEPIAVRGVRVRSIHGRNAISEIEVDRYLPATHTTWPERLVSKNGFQEQILALPGEPSYASVSLGALSMRTARTAVGLKDAPQESGVAWDGTIQDRATIQFRVGPELLRFSEFPDTTRRRLIDGWRPGVEVTSRVNNLQVQEMVFAVPAGGQPAKPALFIRLALRNLSSNRIQTVVQARLTSDRPKPFQNQVDAVICSNLVELVALASGCLVDTSGVMTVRLELPPNGRAHADFVHPQAPVTLAEMAPYRALSFDHELRWFRRYWDQLLETATQIETPEPRVNRMTKAVLAQLFVNGDGNVMPYGSAPSVYEGDIYGIEESYPILALALFGFERDAKRYLEGTLLRRDILEKAERYESAHYRHQQYRNGLEPHYAICAYRLSRDTNWIRQSLPLLQECAEWTIAQRQRTMVLENGRRPLTWGLLPKWAYGGDVAKLQCHPFYANYCCWRGLVDTAWLLAELGDTQVAQRYAAEAAGFRADIDRAMDGSYLPDKAPPYVPLRVSGDRPDELIDFYQLFSGCLLDVEPFSNDSRHLRWISSFMEQDNRTFCLLPRYREAGAGGLDALYGKGYFLSKLHEGSVREFLLSFYAYLAFNLERDTFTGRESTVLYASDLHTRSVFGTPDRSDPLPCSSAVALHLLRNMLVTEERGVPGAYSGNLLLLAGTPANWLQDGKEIRIANLPTHFGPVSINISSSISHGLVSVDLRPPTRNPCQIIKLRMPHPDGKPIRAVQVNGRDWSDFQSKQQMIHLPGDSRHLRVKVYF
jgi:hypothetical protein